MSLLKSAYELASERVIKPRSYYNDVEQEEKFDPEEFFIPIDDLKYPDEIEEEAAAEEKKTIAEEKESVKMVEAERIVFPKEKMMEVHWSGNFLDYGGFARMNRAMAFGLSDRNVIVKPEMSNYLEHVNDATYDLLSRLSNNSISPSAPKVYGATIPLNASHGGRKIYYTMIETSEGIHPDYADKLNTANEVWVPTEYGKKIMVDSGVQVPIYVMPLGVDPSRYKIGLPPLKIRSKLKDFVFVSVFRWGYRKGFDVLLKAFLEAFDSTDDVSLLIVSRPVDCPEEMGNDRILKDFEMIKGMVNKDESEMPHVALYTKPIPEKDMPRVYATGDAFAMISRGEGMGLPYLEAAACGLPVIASNCSGHSDFLNENNSYLVDPSGYKVHRSVDPPYQNMARVCHFYEDQKFPEFDVESIDQLKNHMRYIYEDYGDVAVIDKSKRLRKEILSNYTWEMAVNRVHLRLKEINQEGE